MKIRNYVYCFLFLIVDLTTLDLQAQNPLTMKFINGNALLSPVVHPDRTVTFQIKAPTAQSVWLALSGSKKMPMTKNAEGIWSVTTAPLIPDVYPYRLEVDGVQQPDPANAAGTGGYGISAGQSLVTVPGSPAEAWEFTDVPHGKITTHYYHSTRIGDNRPYLVYTPAGYDAKRKKPYPVLYLLHGLTENEHTWMLSGKANFIMDNLIAARKAVPMLIVCPLGYGDPQHISQGIGGAFESFEKSLVDEIIPQLEKDYHVGKAATDRAITGLSMGAGQALYIGLNHPNMFAYVGGFSSAVVMYGMNRDRSTVKEPEKLLDAPLFTSVFPHVDASMNKKLKRLWIATGDGDGEFAYSMEFKLWLKAKDVQFDEIITPGGHTWMVWKRNLISFAPLLFHD